eukprot:476845-Amphidinium_carterae.1
MEQLHAVKTNKAATAGSQTWVALKSSLVPSGWKWLEKGVLAAEGQMLELSHFSSHESSVRCPTHPECAHTPAAPMPNGKSSTKRSSLLIFADDKRHDGDDAIVNLVTWGDVHGAIA